MSRAGVIDDTELKAMWAAYQVLKTLDRSAQIWAIEWLQCRLWAEECNKKPATAEDNVVRLRTGGQTDEVPF